MAFVKQAQKAKRVQFFKRMRMIISVLALLAIITAASFTFLNRIVVNESAPRIITETQAAQLGNVDCILVLGAGVYENKYPSQMLEDRILESIRLYQLGVSDKLLMSGDNGRVNYNEVLVMKQFAVKHGVPSPDVFEDHAGFSTYESMYRARDVFAAKKIVIVTQAYHLYRAVYIARALGLDAYGVASDPQKYAGQAFRDLREFMARPKDIFSCIIKPLPKYLGDVIPVWGNGYVTN